jgi:uncharacterized membrane protein
VRRKGTLRRVESRATRTGGRPRALSEPLLLGLAALFALAYAIYSIWKHLHFRTDLDLAIFDQGIWHYSHLSSPEITTKVPQVSMLGDHFSPILIGLTPLYWLWSDPRALLIAQAALIAASIVPVFLFARPRMGRVGAYLLAAAYALFWGISAAVSYQFHEIAFAPLLIGLCILFADRRQWTGYWVSLALLMLVKEDMAVLAVFLGLWLISGREVRRGAITAGVGIAWYFLATDVLLPAFGGHSFSYWTYTDFGPNAPTALKNIVIHPDLPFRELFNDPAKRHVLLLLLASSLGLAFGSRLIIVCIPLIAENLFSSRTTQWDTTFHYWLPIAPVLFMAAADGFHNIVGWLRRERSLALAGGLAAGALLVSSLTIASGFPLWTLTKPWDFSLSSTASDRAAQRAIDVVPPDASATVPAPFLPHMSERDSLYLLGQPAPTTEYAILAPQPLPFPDPAYEATWRQQHKLDYRTVYARDGWIVWKRVR